MKSLYPLANKVGSLTTEAVETRAHGLGVIGFGLGHGNAISVKAKGFVSNPSALSAGWSNPTASFSARVDDGKRPLGFKFNDVSVGNQLSLDWVDNLNTVFTQDHLWSNPNQVGSKSQYAAEHQLHKRLGSAAGNNEAVDSKKQNQKKSSASPNIVASRSKGFSHRTIIAGEAE